MQAYVDEQDGAAVRRLTTEFGNIGGPQEALEFLDMNTTAGPSTRIMYSASFMIKCFLFVRQVLLELRQWYRKGSSHKFFDRRTCVLLKDVRPEEEISSTDN